MDSDYPVGYLQTLYRDWMHLYYFVLWLFCNLEQGRIIHIKNRCRCKHLSFNMASASVQLDWVPDSLYNTAVSATVASYYRHRRDVKTLPESVQFDVYYKVNELPQNEHNQDRGCSVCPSSSCLHFLQCLLSRNVHWEFHYNITTEPFWHLLIMLVVKDQWCANCREMTRDIN